MPRSGIYQAVHRTHRVTHAVIALEGETFPVCRGCGSQVQFQLLEAIPHVTHDWDFAGPNLFLVKTSKQRRKKAA